MLTVRADIEASAMEPFALNVDRSGWKVDTYNIVLRRELAIYFALSRLWMEVMS